MAQPALEPGRVLAGKYRLGERLGEGGMGAVYRAEHLVLQAPVAIKVIEREIVADEATKARFAREAQAAAALRSPHVVQILDYGTEGDLPFMVMELLEGETLAQRIRRKRRLSANETSWILSHVARAVAKAHEQGIVHRDLKPDNVFLVKNEDAEVAKVLDFGVAKIEATSLGGGSGDGTHTRTGSLLGTPYYMSPEQAQGNKAIDHRSDLWALAVIAFECLTGKRPFSSDGLGDLVLQICIREIPIPSHVAPVPLGFDGWFERATQREPEGRFQSAKELADSLREALGVELREVPAAPDVQVTVSSSPLSSPPPDDDVPVRKVDAKAPTLAEDSLLRSSEYAIGDVTRRLKREDVAPPAVEEAPRPSQSPRARRSNGRLIVGVGLSALALGALVGVIALSGRQGFRVGDLTAPAAKAAVQSSRASDTSAQHLKASTESPASATSGKATHSAKSSAPGPAPAAPQASSAPTAPVAAPTAPSAAVEPPVAAPETPVPTPPAPPAEAPRDAAPAPAPHDPGASAPKPEEPPSAPGPTPSLPEQLMPPTDVLEPPPASPEASDSFSPSP